MSESRSECLVFSDLLPSGVLDFGKFIGSLCRNEEEAFAVRQSPRFSFFAEYVASSCVKSIVIEERYVDRDYIQDFASYYSLCFTEYPRFCKRCHLFTKPYSCEEINEIVLTGLKSDIDLLQNAYVGFFIFRPLLGFSFGRTCFKPTSLLSDLQKSRFLSKVKVNVGFFGLDLTVECMPFQEQDSNVSACATSALWSAFQVTRYLFGHSAYSPSSITRLATGHDVLSDGCIFPNQGLLREEMLYAIDRVGLGAYCDSRTSKLGMDYVAVKAIAAAYLDIGLPVIAIGEMERIDNGASTFIGRHAFVICGYRFKETCPSPTGSMGLPIVYENIESLCCVDDQVGPYCEISEIRREGGSVYQWRTQWDFSSTSSTSFVACKITDLLIPTYQKIRVSYEEILDLTCKFFSSIINLVREGGGHNEPFLLAQWDIRLVGGNDFKKLIRLSPYCSDSSKRRIAFSNCPKYMWYVSANLGNIPIMTFVIDATDISHGSHVVFTFRRPNICDDPIKTLLKSDSFRAHPFAQRYFEDGFEYSDL